MARDGAPGVEWLIKNFGLDLSLVSRLGGHSQERTHRGKERFPGTNVSVSMFVPLKSTFFLLSLFTSLEMISKEASFTGREFIIVVVFTIVLMDDLTFFFLFFFIELKFKRNDYHLRSHGGTEIVFCLLSLLFLSLKTYFF
tara:strand:- start:548 stop:970 length:423 start_codon:yes stop_codon:yes gene_type:complete